MLGVHVRVFPSFFIFSAILIGLLVYVQLPQIDLATLAFIVAVDVACVFVAFLFVGMVQGLVYRSYGLRTTLVLREFFPGLYPEAEPPTAIQRIVVALANPASAFILYAAVYYSNHEFGWQKENVVLQLSYFILSSLALLWGVIGLLPIFPYSGGRVLLELLQVEAKWAFVDTVNLDCSKCGLHRLHSSSLLQTHEEGGTGRWPNAPRSPTHRDLLWTVSASKLANLANDLGPTKRTACSRARRRRLR